MADFTTAFSIDSLGLPSVANVARDPAAQRQRAITLELARRNLPGPATTDRYAQASLGFKNGAYLAISALMDGLRSAEFTIQSRGRNSKSLSMTASNSEWHPVEEDHPAAKLLRRPNGTQTLGDYLAERMMCQALFGTSLEWVVPSVAGPPCELHILRPQYAIAQASIRKEYPCGWYQLTMPMGGMHGFGYAGVVPIDGREVLKHKYGPNPMYPWDGYTPLMAGAEIYDVFQATVESMKNAMDNGFSPDTVVSIGAGQDQELARMQAVIDGRYTGKGRGQRTMLTATDSVDVQSLNTDPNKMGFGETYTQGINYILASFGVPPMVVGLEEANSYSSLWAAQKQFAIGKMGQVIKALCEFWTVFLIEEHWPDCKVVGELPKINDDEKDLERMSLLAGQQACYVNELRAANGQKPWDGGDVTPMEWQAAIQAKIAPPPQPGMPGDPNQPPAQGGPQDAATDAPAGADSPQDDSPDAFPHSVMQSVLGAFGVDGSGIGADGANGAMNPETLAPSDPQTAAITKSLRRWLKGFSESAHPRDDSGKFISAHDLREATVNPRKAKELKASVTDPEQRKKLMAALGEKTGQERLKPGGSRELVSDHLEDYAKRSRGGLNALVKDLHSDGDPKAFKTSFREWANKTRNRLLGTVKSEADRTVAQLKADYPDVDAEHWSDLHGDLMTTAKEHIDPALTNLAATLQGHLNDGLDDEPSRELRQSVNDAHRELVTAVGKPMYDELYDMLEHYLGNLKTGKEGSIPVKRTHPLGRYFKAWTRGTSSAGHTTATDGTKVLYGPEAEAALKAQDAPVAGKPAPVPLTDEDRKAIAKKYGAGIDLAGFHDETGAPVNPKPSAQKLAPTPIPGHDPSQLTDEFDERDAKPGDATRSFGGDAGATKTHPVAKLAHEAAAKLDPATVPMAKEYIQKMKRGGVKHLKPSPQQRKQIADPAAWLPMMITTYLPAFTAAMQMGKGPASKLLIFGVLAMLNHLSQQRPAAEEEPIRPGDDQLRDRKKNRVETDLVPTAMPAKPVPQAQPKKAGAGTPKATSTAGKGSLPPRMKAMDWEAGLAAMLEETLLETA